MVGASYRPTAKPWNVSCKTLDMIINTDSNPILRVDFSEDNAWNKVKNLVKAGYDEIGLDDNIEFYSKIEFNNATAEQIISSLSKDREWWFLLIADKETMTNSEHTILCVDLREELGRTFRVIPQQIIWVESNLSILNMDFSDFYRATDSDGIFRGFPEGPF